MCSPAGAGGYNKPSPGAGLCGTGFICCTQAAPTGGGWVQKHTALVPVCVGLASSAAPKPPPPGAGGHKNTQPRGRFVWDWLHLLHPSRPHRGRVGIKNQPWSQFVGDWPWLLRPNRPHRGRVGTKRPSPGAGLCGAGRLCCTQAAPTGGGWVQQTQPWSQFVGDWPWLLHPSRPHRGRVGIKNTQPRGQFVRNWLRGCCTEGE